MERFTVKYEWHEGEFYRNYIEVCLRVRLPYKNCFGKVKTHDKVVFSMTDEKFAESKFITNQETLEFLIEKYAEFREASKYQRFINRKRKMQWEQTDRTKSTKPKMELFGTPGV